MAERFRFANPIEGAEPVTRVLPAVDATRPLRFPNACETCFGDPEFGGTR